MAVPPKSKKGIATAQNAVITVGIVLAATLPLNSFRSDPRVI